MKRLGLILLVCLFAGGPAIAEQNYVQLKTVIQPGPLRDTCKSVKGEYSVAEDGKSYSCVKHNCDGKGGDCAVACTGYSCTGTTPARIVGPTTLIGLLQNGDMVLRAPRGDGGSLRSPGLFTPKPPAQSTEPAPTDGTLY